MLMRQTDSDSILAYQQNLMPTGHHFKMQAIFKDSRDAGGDEDEYGV